MQERGIPDVFVRSAAGGSQRQAEYLWHAPQFELGYRSPGELWSSGGPLERSALQQIILRVFMADRTRPSRLAEMPEPLANLVVIRQ